MRKDYSNIQLNAGDKIFVCEYWSQNIYQATVVKVYAENNTLYAQYTYDYLVDADGNEVTYGIHGGTSAAKFDDIWFSAKEAYTEIAARRAKIVKTYCDEIVTVKDLLEFPLNHCLDGEEYTDYEAIEAYKIKVKELLDIEVE